MEKRVVNTGGFSTREEGKAKVIEGYFAVFDKPYEVCPGWIEEIAPGAFDRTLKEGGDVKTLWNHNTDIVLGSTANGTATLAQDEKGLRGEAQINTDDTDALNAYARIARGDVRGCSFGFDILSQEEMFDEDGTYRTRLTDIRLYEVSPCTFPAYQQTSISARNSEALEAAKKRLREAKEQKIKERRERITARLRKE